MAWIKLIGGTYVNSHHIKGFKVNLQMDKEYYIECFMADEEKPSSWTVSGPYDSEEEARGELKKIIDNIEYSDSKRKEV